MNCPLDNTPLAIAERQGIEIDYCPTCRGVWLDRGELDKLIERNAQYNANLGVRDEDDDLPLPSAAPYPQSSPQPPFYPQQPPSQQPPVRAGSDIAGVALDLIQKGLNKRRDAGHSSGYGGRKKKGGLLGELFDF